MVSCIPDHLVSDQKIIAPYHAFAILLSDVGVIFQSGYNTRDTSGCFVSQWAEFSAFSQALCTQDVVFLIPM